MSNVELERESSTSKSLLSGLRVGKAAAWARVAELYGPLIRSWCSPFGLDDATQDDIAQTVLLEVIRNASEFRKTNPEHGFRKWLRTITERRIIDLYRKNKRQIPYEPSKAQHLFDMLESGQFRSSATQEAEDQLRLLQRAIRLVLINCNEQTRLIFMDAVYSGWDYQTIAERHQTSVGNVRKIKSSYLGKIRDMLEMTDSDDRSDED